MANIKDHFRVVTNTESGIAVLRWFMDFCGYQKPVRILNGQTDEVNLVATACNATLADAWIEARKFIPLDSLILIEHNKTVTEPVQVKGDLDGRTSPSTNEHSSTSNAGYGGRLSRRNIAAESIEYTRQYLESLGYTVKPTDSPAEF